jgi:hypothetical protein
LAYTVKTAELPQISATFLTEFFNGY